MNLIQISDATSYCEFYEKYLDKSYELIKHICVVNIEEAKLMVVYAQNVYQHLKTCPHCKIAPKCMEMWKKVATYDYTNPENYDYRYADFYIHLYECKECDAKPKKETN